MTSYQRMRVLAEADGTVRLIGEVDMDTAGQLETILEQALSDRDDGAPLTLDMSEVTFCDSTGLNALLRTRHLAERTGSRMSVPTASDQVTRLFLITGTGDLFGCAAASTRRTS